ncbi:hypothetical protein BGX28_005694 [Mortierella sp. GBA30]|nr:hypothetical protein BGX28_005694 [Mortierella sp. GBA30]
MSWLAKNVGSLGNLASRIAAEANGDLQTNEALQQLNQQLEETRGELSTTLHEWDQAKQGWERAQQNYEARLKSLTEGNATAQKVEELEHKLNRAVELLKTLSSDKKNLVAKIKTLEDEKSEAVSAATAAVEAAKAAEEQISISSRTLNHEAADNDMKIHELEQELRTEKEQNAKVFEELNAQLSDALESNKKLEDKLEELSTSKQEESDIETDLSIQLKMTKEDLQQAKDEIMMLKEANATLLNKSKVGPASPSQAPSPALVKELADAKATIANLESRLSKESESLKKAAALAANHKELQGRVNALQEELRQTNEKRSEVVSELSNSKEAQDALERKEASMMEPCHLATESIKRLESELAATKARPPTDSAANGVHDKSKELQSRVQSLERELQVSKQVFSEEQIDAVAVAIQTLLDSSRKEALPKSLTNDKILATWNRAKDEVDSYKDGNRSLEDNLSRLRKEGLEAQSVFNTKFELLESEKAKELELIRKEHEQAISELLATSQRNTRNQDDVDRQLSDLKMAEEQAVQKLKEQYAEEKSRLLVTHDSLTKELEALRKRFEDESLANAQAKEKRELLIQDLERQVATHDQILKTVKDDLQKTVNERNHFQSQHKTLLDRVSNMKSTLGSKLQADMVEQQIDQLTVQNNDYLHTIKQLEEELMASHEHYEKTSRELEHLRRRLVDIQEDASAEVVEKENLIHELQSRLQREEREREDWETMAQEQRASKDQAVANMRAMERERDAARAEKDSLLQELDREMESLNNLQTVLEEFQSAKESEIQFALEGLHRQLNASNASLEEYQGRAQAAEEQLRHLTMDVERARQLEREVKEKNLTIGKLRHDAVIQQGHLTEAMRRLKEENSQNTVDIPLISNLFISFLNIPRGDQKRFEILQLISGVLKFTDEQREQAGLIRKAGSGLGAMTPTTSGSRSPSMEQMRQHQEPKEPLQIHWHDKQPIYSAHFEPGPKGRLATAGGDGNVRLWKVVKDKEKDSTHIEFLSSLNRHTAAVNVVRFSPTAECLASAGDDGNIILWKPTENKEAVNRFAESEDDEFERETWRVQSMMRGSLSDIYDLAWSPDGRYIISGSIDNTARIWDVKDAKCIHVIADHHHYVQGVAWDPLGEFVATQSSDRSVHIYAFKIDKHGHVAVTSLGKNTKLDLSKLRSVPPLSTTTGGNTANSASNKSKGEGDVAADATADKEDATKPTRAGPKSFRLYHDETLTSFFRRLSFTPDGSMLLTPAGQYKAPVHKHTTQRDDEPNIASQTLELETRNTVYVYARRDFNKGPIAHLPGHKKPSVAIKCSPVLYELRNQLQPPTSNSTYQRGAQDVSKETKGKLEAPKPPSVFGLDYRFIYAVATQDSILIYDTQQTAALALVSHIHYATFTDMTWSSDGCSLILTSSDGFCSIISFEEGELGTVYTPPKVMMDLMPTSDSGAMSLPEPLDSAVSIAATAGMLQKLNGLSLAEQKEQKEHKEQQPKGKAKQDKGESTGEGKKKSVKQLFAKTKNSSASVSAMGTGSTVAAASPKPSFKTERDGDSIMISVNEQPAPKKRRIQPTFVSALPGSPSPATPAASSSSTSSPTSASVSGSPNPSVAGSSVTSSSSSSGTDSKPKIKRIQPIFVSALPGR